MTPPFQHKPDQPWIFRPMPAIPRQPKATSSTARTWRRDRRALGAFDLLTQTGYDSDHIPARGEVGKVGRSGISGTCARCSDRFCLRR